MFTLEYAKNPAYSDTTGNCIILTVKWAEFLEEHSFGATSYDIMAHGVDLYHRAKAGEFGEIVPYESPAPAPNQPQTQGAQTL